MLLDKLNESNEGFLHMKIIVMTPIPDKDIILTQKCAQGFSQYIQKHTIENKTERLSEKISWKLSANNI